MIETIIASTKQHFATIAELADIIWRAHYIPITGKPQIDYMLKKFQSAKAIEEQVKNGYEYYLLLYNNAEVGYISIKKEDGNSLFLSKIYVLGAYRGKKIGKTAMNFIVEKGKAYNLNKIRLTVNINNTNSIKAYEKMGFKYVGPLLTDIGEGFVMDDHEMVKEI